MHTRGQVIEFIEKVFGNGIQSNQGLNISVACPICRKTKDSTYDKKKLVIRTDNFLTHCWICGYKSKNILELIQKFRKEYSEEYVKGFLNSEELFAEVKENLKEDQSIRLPNDFELLATADRQDPVVRRYIAYLKSRGIKNINLENSLWYWRFGFSRNDPRYKDRIIFPSFDRIGNLNYFTARSINKFTKPKYVNPPVNRNSIIFNEIIIDWKKPLVLVEGPFDLIKCTENATCILGSELNNDYLLFQNIIRNNTPIILALDPDAQDKQNKIAKELYSWNIDVKVLEIPEKYSDVGEMDSEVFISILKDAIPFSIKYSLKSKIARII